MGKIVHVAPLGDKWAVKEEGRDSPLSTRRTQDAAVEAATPIARIVRVGLRPGKVPSEWWRC